MNAIVPISAKIVPLLARLGSDSEGERLACLRQLDRVLGRAGITWTDFAHEIGARRELTREPDIVLRDWRCAVEWIGSHPHWDPGGRERDFIANMGRILKRHQPTEKQAEWIRGIVGRLGGRMDA